MESTMEDGMETQVHRDTSGTWLTDFSESIKLQLYAK